MVEIMFLAAYADGSINEAERAELARHVAAMSEGRVGADLVESLISIIERSVRDEGRSGRFAALRARLPDVRMREAAIEAGRPPRGRRRRDPRERGALLVEGGQDPRRADRVQGARRARLKTAERARGATRAAATPARPVVPSLATTAIRTDIRR